VLERYLIVYADAGQVIMLIHGGAQAAWNDQWSTRFNVAVWASQGYMYGNARSRRPTPHACAGSSSRTLPARPGSARRLSTPSRQCSLHRPGPPLTGPNRRDWGGAPFVDMRAGWRALLARHPEADATRAGALGGSWGGYGIKCARPCARSQSC
jgi:hypothetical protein